MDEEGNVAAIVDHELWAEQAALAVRKAESFVRTPPKLFEGLTLPGEDGDTSSSDAIFSSV